MSNGLRRKHGLVMKEGDIVSCFANDGGRMYGVIVQFWDEKELIVVSVENQGKLFLCNKDIDRVLHTSSVEVA